MCNRLPFFFKLFVIVFVIIYLKCNRNRIRIRQKKYERRIEKSNRPSKYYSVNMSKLRLSFT